MFQSAHAIEQINYMWLNRTSQILHDGVKHLILFTDSATRVALFKPIAAVAHTLETPLVIIIGINSGKIII